MRTFVLAWVIGLSTSLCAPHLGAQQGWPARPIRLIVNSTPGSGVDVVTRAVASQLSEAVGQTFVIDNRPGAGGNVGLEIVARAAPDAHTLLASPGGGIVIAPYLSKLGVNVDTDIAVVSPTASLSIFLVVRSGLPVRSVADLIAYARAHPNKLNFGSSGNGSSLHIAAEMFLRKGNVQAVHVPYKGGALAVTALLGGQIDFFFDPGPALIHVKAEKLRALGIARGKRSTYFPDIPTLAEAGVDVDLELVQGIYAPAGTPNTTITRLNREIGRIMQTAEIRAVLAAIGGEAVIASAEEFTLRLKRDRDRFGAFIREAKIQAQ